MISLSRLQLHIEHIGRVVVGVRVAYTTSRHASKALWEFGSLAAYVVVIHHIGIG